CLSVLMHTAAAEIYPLSLHAALPISVDSTSWRAICIQRRCASSWRCVGSATAPDGAGSRVGASALPRLIRGADSSLRMSPLPQRSEEHTSELQSRENLVCRLLLEKKK